MKIYIPRIESGHKLIDLLGGPTSINQGEIGKIEFNRTYDLDDSDFILVPHPAKEIANNSIYLSYLTEISRNKTLVISNRGDFPINNLPFKNKVELRVAREPNEKFNRIIQVPYNIIPLKAKINRVWSENFIASFTGYIPKISTKRLGRVILTKTMHPLKGDGAIPRNFIYWKYKKNPNFKIVARSHYGGAASLVDDFATFREEFENSILNCDYVISPRGDANQSYRFYEALSAGRIPVIPNSNMSFPNLNEKLPKDFYIESNSIGSNLHKVIERHWKSLDSEKYFQLQFRIKEFYFKNFFFPTFMNDLFKLTASEFLYKSRFQD